MPIFLLSGIALPLLESHNEMIKLNGENVSLFLMVYLGSVWVPE